MAAQRHFGFPSEAARFPVTADHTTTMRRSLPGILLALLIAPLAAHAQVLDQTLVPAGRLRLQASPVFDSWSSRYGRAPDGAEGVEELGDDLTDPATVSLFPGIAALATAVGDVTTAPFDPVIGATSGRVQQDVTRIEFAAHLGVLDWLTVGVVFPWTRTRSAIDVAFRPDTLNANLGLNPTITSAASVDAFLASTAAAGSAAAGYAAAECTGGASPACSAAQDLAARAAAFDAALGAAYGASPFFPLSSTPVGDGLLQAAAALSADLAAAGLVGLAPLVLSSDMLVDEGDMALLPAVVGSGIQSGPLTTRQSLWSAGDIEVSARVLLLDNLMPEGEEWIRPGVGYRVTASALVRLPTGTRPDPDLSYDLGTGEGQTDVEGSVTAMVRLGTHLGLTAGGYYGAQGATTITRRVAPPEQVLAPLSTRTQVTWRPGAYMGFGLAPTLHPAPSLTVHAEYRFFHKARDEFQLVDSTLPLAAAVLGVESGVKAHVFGGGLRWNTVGAWRRGEATRPMEVHLRVLKTVGGSGGQVPKATRVEAGVRLFRRLWGPNP